MMPDAGISLQESQTQPPFPPQNLIGERTTSASVMLSWLDPDVNIVRFHIYRQADGDSWTQIASVLFVEGQIAYGYTDADAPDVATLIYRVTAVNRFDIESQPLEIVVAP